MFRLARPTYNMYKLCIPNYYPLPPVPSLEDTPCRRLLATALRQSYQPPAIPLVSPTHKPHPSEAAAASGQVSTSPACITVHPVPLRVTVEAQFVVTVDDCSGLAVATSCMHTAASTCTVASYSS